MLILCTVHLTEIHKQASQLEDGTIMYLRMNIWIHFCLISSIIMKACFFSPKIFRFRDGLKTLGVLQEIKLHPEAFRPVLCYTPSNLTANTLDILFIIQWSETGSNNRSDENRVVGFWRDFLQDLEGGHYVFSDF